MVYEKLSISFSEFNKINFLWNDLQSLRLSWPYPGSNDKLTVEGLPLGLESAKFFVEYSSVDIFEDEIGMLVPNVFIDALPRETLNFEIKRYQSTRRIQLRAKLRLIRVQKKLIGL